MLAGEFTRPSERRSSLQLSEEPTDTTGCAGGVPAPISLLLMENELLEPVAGMLGLVREEPPHCVKPGPIRDLLLETAGIQAVDLDPLTAAQHCLGCVSTIAGAHLCVVEVGPSHSIPPEHAVCRLRANVEAFVLCKGLQTCHGRHCHVGPRPACAL